MGLEAVSSCWGRIVLSLARKPGEARSSTAGGDALSILRIRGCKPKQCNSGQRQQCMEAQGLGQGSENEIMLRRKAVGEAANMAAATG
jgi:hypothetical protein